MLTSGIKRVISTLRRVAKMPSIETHINNSIAKRDLARKTAELMDMPPLSIGFSPEIHTMWRKRTHNLSSAFYIGLMVGMDSETPKKCIIDAIRHVNDDLAIGFFTKLIKKVATE